MRFAIALKRIEAYRLRMALRHLAQVGGLAVATGTLSAQPRIASGVWANNTVTPLQRPKQ